MYIVLVTIHMIACLILIATILLQAGRGGGLTDAFGGGEMAQSVLGTQAPVLLKKITAISAILFLVTSLLFGMLTANKGKSLFEQIKVPVLPAASSQEAAPAAQAPIAQPKN